MISELDFFEQVFLYVLENSYGCLCEEVQDFKSDAENMKQSDYTNYKFKLLKYVTQQRKLVKISRYKSFEFFIQNGGRSLVKEINQILFNLNKNKNLIQGKSAFEMTMNKFYQNCSCGLSEFVKKYITREAFDILIEFVKIPTHELTGLSKELVNNINSDISNLFKYITKQN